MDSFADTVSNLTLYDIKSAVRKVQNVVMNFTEMEAKVREATNNEPWGASSTQLAEIADGTHNFSTFNEIMPMIYRRFTEKTAEEWRQIYKALQLLEYLVKNGSERVIDDARSHLSTLKMLRNFHYIDEKMKDQGVNVRNRAKELVDLLQDSERIRQERRKAKSGRNKFGGVSSDSAFMTAQHSGGFGGSGKKYGGFSSDDYGGGGGGAPEYSSGGASKIYGDGGGTGEETLGYGEASGVTRSSSTGGARRERSERPKAARPVRGFAEDALGSVAQPAERFDEYDEYDEGAAGGSGSSRPAAERQPSYKTTIPKPIPKKEEAKPKEVDLFSFDDEPAPAIAPASSATLPKLTTSAPAALDDDDEFDDFQSASTSVAAPQPAKQAAMMSVMGPASPQKPQYSGFQSIQPMQASNSGASNNASLLGGLAGQPTLQAPRQQQQPSAPTGPNYYASGLFATQTTGNKLQPVASPAILAAQQKPKAAAGDAFGDLLSGFKKSSTPTKGTSLSEMNKQTASAGIWGASAPSKSAAPKEMDDEWGDFNGASAGKPAASAGQGGNNDLLF
ncbi:hypothetical protein BCR37DRAFT_359509 [Protomyces lactucae-debilis]|uniref:ENTH domain-containing protein n=1 Tax=Protomyces lactucae-debilis TaxID=2754530 RepID=A0A1Y2FC83_PROLT|nr:uncharacterized protein BCR37DRAFT_359509 [Protomyces lactucae-debilis]ORY80465.1 hypothetical protein BCR37DRAFT_359509 [Protomyces lactucae-debilis]